MSAADRTPAEQAAMLLSLLGVASDLVGTYWTDAESDPELDPELRLAAVALVEQIGALLEGDDERAAQVARWLGNGAQR